MGIPQDGHLDRSMSTTGFYNKLSVMMGDAESRTPGTSLRATSFKSIFNPNSKIHVDFFFLLVLLGKKTIYQLNK